MKKITLILVSFLFFACKAQEKTAFSKEVLAAPMVSLSGDDLTFQQLIDNQQGKITVIEVWASWCSDCIKGLPKLKKLQEKHPNANYVFISLDKNQTDWKKGINRFSIKGDHYYVEGGWKSIFAKNIDLDWIPRYIVIDETGKVLIYRAIEADDSRITNVLEN
ncbi:TlpA family protein disulfide reductase [Wenyingzhuangia marina]|uniref:Thiol-disulfide isomerase or thioredoxin n=1 Tax=Wenyingzhuangia marina TaxID=1195760 RepID=A0A1M5V3Y6_9FLAO|nr:TlpA disulfide reductase family protein [Wenyingzhuangia marina]GGF74628.1 alkyl hydroperoxide reductase [Wenyingzhuangia marina]SHH69838.1 Thiol-disulfide isomerase or thioredoxin [Wenyingzhuangia marina]